MEFEIPECSCPVRGNVCIEVGTGQDAGESHSVLLSLGKPFLGQGQNYLSIAKLSPFKTFCCFFRMFAFKLFTHDLYFKPLTSRQGKKASDRPMGYYGVKFSTRQMICIST